MTGGVYDHVHLLKDHKQEYHLQPKYSEPYCISDNEPMNQSISQQITLHTKSSQYVGTCSVKTRTLNIPETLSRIIVKTSYNVLLDP